MRRIAINHIIDQIRSEKNYQIKLNEARINSHNGHHITFNQGEQKLNFESLIDLLDILPISTRNVFNLFAIDGLTHKEIGDHLNISIGTSKWHVAQARKCLQKHIDVQNNNVLNIDHSSILNVKNS